MGKKIKIGHNSISGDQLKAIIGRMEKLEEDRQGVTDDMKDVMAEAKGNGYDPKIIKAILKMRKEDEATRKEHQTLVGLYCEALGMEDPFS